MQAEQVVWVARSAGVAQAEPVAQVRRVERAAWVAQPPQVARGAAVGQLSLVAAEARGALGESSARSCPSRRIRKEISWEPREQAARLQKVQAMPQVWVVPVTVEAKEAEPRADWKLKTLWRIRRRPADSERTAQA